MVDPVSKALDELRTGFQSVIEISWCKSVGMSAADLRLVICGNVDKENINRDFDVRDLFRLRMDESVSDSPALQNALFGAIDAMTPTDKRMFLKFVTGVDKLPLPKTECLKIEAPELCFSEEEFRQQWARLPTAHTCFNTLEVPNYAACLLELEHGGRAADEIDDLESFQARLLKHVTGKLAVAIANTEGGGYGLDTAVRNRETTMLSNFDLGVEETKEEDLRLNKDSKAYGGEVNESEDKHPLETGRTSIQSFEAGDSDGSVDIPGLTESDNDDDIFNDF